MKSFQKIENDASSHLENAISNYLNNVTIDKDFIDYRNNEVERNRKVDISRGYYRDDATLKMHADCTILEYLLINNQIVEPPSHRWRHDFKLFGLKLDAKRVYQWFSVPDYKLIQYLESVKQNELTHFMFWNYNFKPSSPFKEGDSIGFIFLGLKSVQEVMNELKPSKYNEGKDYYYGVYKHEKSA
jgi:hypothetical protein